VLTLVCVLMLRGAAFSQSPGREKPIKDDRAALQKSMNDFKRSVGGKLAEEAQRPSSSALARPSLTGLQIRSSVLVPDGGETLLGGISDSAEGRNSRGIGPLQNRSYGRQSSKTTASVRVWLIIFEEEEERQTGYSPRK
jgi:hypothetical protein